ncbi:MAG: phosphatase PAP2 family protein [Solirubrobacterales bacterium]
MPVLILLIVAAAAGLAAAALARALMRRGPVTGPRAARLDPEQVSGLVLTLALAALIAGGALLAALAVIVRSTEVLSGLDHGVAAWGDRHASAFSHAALTAITDLGETWAVAAVAAIVVLVDFLRRRSLWALAFLLAVIAGDKLITELLKELVDRARPALEPVAATLGPSFPSGHSSTAAASWAAFALVASRWWGRRAWPALAGVAVGIAVAVALSRVLLDVHWLTDVVAGLALGWAWFAACAIAFGRWLLPRPLPAAGSPRPAP